MKKDFLVISDNRVIHKIPHAEIVHIESRGMRSNIHTSSGERHSCSKNLGVLFKELNKDNMFFRVYTSFAVNILKVARVKKDKNAVVIMSNGTIIPLSKRRRSEFYKRYLETSPDFQE